MKDYHLCILEMEERVDICGKEMSNVKANFYHFRNTISAIWDHQNPTQNSVVSDQNIQELDRI